MVKKISQETLTRFGFFGIIWVIICFFINIFNPIFGYGPNSEQNLTILFWVFLMFPAYITNIIQNIDKLNLLDYSYLWGFHLNGLWVVFFWLFAGLYFSSILTLLSGDNEKIKNLIWKFHFGFFTIALILKAVHGYFGFPDRPVIGSNNFMMFLSNTILIVINIYILTRIKKEVNYEFLKNTIKQYFFTISELLLALFVAFAFYNYSLSSDASGIDRISVPLVYLFGGFFFFLCLRLIRIRFKEGP